MFEHVALKISTSIKKGIKTKRTLSINITNIEMNNICNNYLKRVSIFYTEVPLAECYMWNLLGSVNLAVKM